MKGPSFSLRDVPWTIYVAIAINVTVTLALFLLAVGRENDSETWESLERWFLLDGAATNVYFLMLPLGILELARRQVGAPRTLATIAAWLLLVGVLWVVFSFAVTIANPKEHPEELFEWFGRFSVLAMAGSAIVLTIAADAWRRVPLAAIGMLLVIVTSYRVPVIGPAIADLFTSTDSFAPRFLYTFLREAITCASLIFVAGALAARGHVIPAPDRAYVGLQLARGALLARLVAALLFVLFAFAATKSPGSAKLIAVGVPAVAIVTAILYAIGMIQVASSQVAGMPRALFAIGAMCVLWWTFVQIEHVEALVTSFRDRDELSFLGEQVERKLTMFSVAGPILATAGMILCAIGVHRYAANTDQPALAAAIAGRIAGFVTLMVAAVALQSGLIIPKSAGGAVMLLLVIAAINVGALVTYTGLLAQAASSIDRPSSNLPPARLL